MVEEVEEVEDVAVTVRLLQMKLDTANAMRDAAVARDNFLSDNVIDRLKKLQASQQKLQEQMADVQKTLGEIKEERLPQAEEAGP